MASFRDRIRLLSEATATTPFECPCGWGQVSFHLTLAGFPFPPFFSLPRKCPIGGVRQCSKCHYSMSPQGAP